MAVYQISKIQVRRGQTNQTGVPQLASGEFGWSIDTQELFIGNGSVSEGAPAVGNTQIITEHNIGNFFSYAATEYQYKGVAPAIKRQISDKLDDIVNLNDFIPVNYTSTDYTQFFASAIQTAASVKKPLYVPEGNYLITSTIYIPAFTEVRGAGMDKTNITMASTASIFQTISTFGITGVNIPGDASRPRSININGVTFNNSTTNANPMIQFDCVSDSKIESCKFVGNGLASNGSSSFANGIDLKDNASGLTVKNIKIDGCVFKKLGTAITSDHDIQNLTVTKSVVYITDRGFVFGENLTGTGSQKTGAKNVTLIGNTFDIINKEALYSGNTSTTELNTIKSIGNTYNNVGTNGLGDLAPHVSDVITFKTIGNTSLNDTFGRLININSNTQINSTMTAISPINGPVLLKCDEVSVYNITTTNTLTPMFILPRGNSQFGSNNQTVELEYTISKPQIGMSRTGVLEVNVVNNTASIKDVYNTNLEELDNNGLPVGVIFSAEIDTVKNLITISLNNKSSELGTITYTYVVRQ